MHMSKSSVLKKEAHEKQKGAELFEFAVVLPLFLLLLVGIIEFGRGYNIYQNVIHATREGVRAAVADCLTGGNCTPGSSTYLSDNQIRDKIRENLRAINIDVANPSTDIVINSTTPLTVPGFTDGSSTFSMNIPVYNVRVTYNYNFLFLGAVLQLAVPNATAPGSTISITATVEMMKEEFSS